MLVLVALTLPIVIFIRLAVVVEQLKVAVIVLRGNLAKIVVSVMGRLELILHHYFLFIVEILRMFGFALVFILTVFRTQNVLGKWPG